MDWTAFLDDNDIPYVTRGPNTKKGEVSIKCPFCGDEDPSEHMGISLTKELWGCYRNPGHRGRSPVFLVGALLHCNSSQARIVVKQYSAADPESFEEACAILEGIPDPIRSKVVKTYPGKLILNFPTTIGPINATGPTAKFWRYLHNRGFDDIGKMVQQYQLMCALTGHWKDRVIIPFYQNRNLIGWTGRAIIDPVKAPRYLSSSEVVKQTVFNVDNLEKGGDFLFVTEGPFDALKLDYYGGSLNAHATCVFGVTMTIEQIVILSRLKKLFKRMVILFDHDALEPSFHAVDWLYGPNVSIGQLPAGVKDPGIMEKDEIAKFIKSF